MRAGLQGGRGGGKSNSSEKEAQCKKMRVDSDMQTADFAAVDQDLYSLSCTMIPERQNQEGEGTAHCKSRIV